MSGGGWRKYEAPKCLEVLQKKKWSWPLTPSLLGSRVLSVWQTKTEAELQKLERSSPKQALNLRAEELVLVLFMLQGVFGRALILFFEQLLQSSTKRLKCRWILMES